MEDKNILKNSDLFGGLNDMELDLLVRIIRQKNYKRGHTIFFEGDEGDGFYLIKKGQAKIYKTGGNGKEQILHILGSGETFGEVAVFQGRSFPASATALDALDVLYFPKREFTQFIERNPLVAMHMLAFFGMRLRQFTKQIESLALKEVPQRLADYLLLLSQEQDGEKVTLLISKGQLASLLGTAPETLSRILQQFCAENLISMQGKDITLLDKQGLEQRGQG